MAGTPICYDAIEGDTARKLKITALRSDGVPVNLTGATVTFRYRDANGQPQSRVMTVIDPINGVAEYQFAANELVAPTLYYQINIVDGSGNELTGDCIDALRVGKRLA